ncbi:hypothetical protein KV697_10700 [Sphingomonas sanguinis]|uniref:hypothetical protein n=1 Tax=Sphingomonas sanguinis TaxID=33051 RepID=UPI001C596CEC|nr:hypothetical protein [Sphingomonas sanguinis]QXT34303.1 hypothetical protein KV697_10700 [Sphingomonas sanguinis]
MRYGADDIGQLQSRDRFTLQFALDDRTIRFVIPFAAPEQIEATRGRRAFEDAANQARRQRGRALLLVIKAKLESIESGIETTEQAFLANVVMPSDRTVHEHIAPAIAAHYAGKKTATPLLPGPTR